MNDSQVFEAIGRLYIENRYLSFMLSQLSQQLDEERKKNANTTSNPLNNPQP